jgi:hypothetical protein
MRATVEIDGDVLTAARQLAESMAQSMAQSLGQTLSDPAPILSP